LVRGLVCGIVRDGAISSVLVTSPATRGELYLPNFDDPYGAELSEDAAVVLHRRDMVNGSGQRAYVYADDGATIAQIQEALTHSDGDGYKSHRAIDGTHTKSVDLAWYHEALDRDKVEFSATFPDIGAFSDGMKKAASAAKDLKCAFMKIKTPGQYRKEYAKTKHVQAIRKLCRDWRRRERRLSMTICAESMIR
jgi:hypothetical protein